MMGLKTIPFPTPAGASGTPMKVVHALQPLEASIFLAGPTPRDAQTPSWRPQALEILAELGFDGTVYVPESADWSAHDNYDAQVAWEVEALNKATVVAFWIPRHIESMPAFTTNVEFGMYLKSGRAALGHPTDAPKMRYLASIAGTFHVPVVHDLRALMELSLKRIAELTAKA